jgi:hypothetical protein
MSDYVREKVLRVPCEKYGIKSRELEEKFGGLFGYRKNGMFQCSPTETDYIDFVIESEYGADFCEFGKQRVLLESEKARFAPIFRQIIPDIDMNDVRLVEFCWDNCCEAPDYYDEIDDPFYNEVFI